MMQRAVFLDRDDTLIANADLALAHPGDLLDPSLVRLLAGAAVACRELHDAGFRLVVVSNQGGVARGHGTIADVEACNARMRELLRAEAGVELDGVYYCPYHPKGTVPPFNAEHPSRKPAPGMILQAAEDLGLDLSRSWLIGDAPRDIEAATAAGIPSRHAILVGRAPGAEFPDLASAARHVLARAAG
jgi:D-glycero-D-manno-heptose 1,7-bisphosphate phosphatase